MLTILINYFISVLGPLISKFYMSIGFRWFIYMSAFLLNILAYYENPVLFTDSKKCYGMSCRLFSFLAGMCAMALGIFGLIALWYCAPFSSFLPDYWYIPVAIITFAIIAQITISVEVQTDNGEFNHPPEFLWRKQYRYYLYVLILILDLIFFHQLWIDGGKQLIENPRVIDDLILGRFGGWNENKFNFMVEWFGSIQILFDILAIWQINSFQSCNYGLPPSWDY
jgi:hypothetical protein